MLVPEEVCDRYRRTQPGALSRPHRWWALGAGPTSSCSPSTTRAPDLSLDVRDLGSIYLGGTAPSTLVRAGHFQAHGSTVKADALFRAERPPHCLHWF
ncbi:sterol carrier protein domain-containing protein [Lentzea albidocapillata]|uniref:sterol carrier protein domain-containing protein n=1 Tax=Lentzea albidocapillata TaxID=40571 RepID=UPI000ABF154C|nr:sterol carrier protein domain-containing protein [Lentzea albidocapillata]